MNKFTFQFDITGSANIEIKAKDIEEAINMLKNGEGKNELLEWDFDFPHDFRKLDKEDMELYLVSEDKV